MKKIHASFSKKDINGRDKGKQNAGDHFATVPTSIAVITQ
ncbi:hypothetical protein GPLA_3093 [Paraglaciecola polaris LMG 21857]|uniref:Uncharacterized protein n=1 Tax=Paraglaciecola polaris LMG 21857 TaxID=1129793 RepID=K6YMR7_9ALTE|nr:hypothetical protein GPLA_3093 [Paraglaciecola polaris LMG 21857]